MTKPRRQRPLAARCPPPRGFEPAGEVTYARIAPKPPAFANAPAPRGRLLRAGLRFEAQGCEALAESFPLQFAQGPWLQYRSAHRPADLRWCEPDALLVDVQAGIITIIEFKWRHTTDAWWQTRRLYEPVLGKLLGTDKWQFRICEIVRWFEKRPFPEYFEMVRSPLEVPVGKFGVSIWSPGRRF